MEKAVRLFEDLHTLAHRWTQYCSDHHHETFQEFLETNEPVRAGRLYRIYQFVDNLADEEAGHEPD